MAACRTRNPYVYGRLRQARKRTVSVGPSQPGDVGRATIITCEQAALEPPGALEFSSLRKSDFSVVFERIIIRAKTCRQSVQI